MREYLQSQKECAKMGHEWEEVPGGSWCSNCDAFSPYIDDDFDDEEWEWESQELDEPATTQANKSSNRNAHAARSIKH